MSNTTILKTKKATALISYSTLVAIHVNDTTNCLVTEQRYSNTTSKHIAAFMKRQGLAPEYRIYISQDALDAAAEDLGVPVLQVEAM